jgi:hypothetical protein
MDDKQMTGRTPALGQIVGIWRGFDALPTWTALAAALGGLGEALCVIRWPIGVDRPVIERAGAQAILAYGTPLTGEPAEALTPGRADAVAEAMQARTTGAPIVVEDDLRHGTGVRRIARLYLPLDETPAAVACAIVRID